MLTVGMIVLDPCGPSERPSDDGLRRKRQYTKRVDLLRPTALTVRAAVRASKGLMMILIVQQRAT